MNTIKLPNLDKPVRPGQITVPQVGYLVSQQELWQQLPQGVTYATYRKIRKDPTIALARSLVIATLLSGEWSVEADEDVDDDVVKFITSMMLPLREEIVEASAIGVIDFGWQAFEKVFKVRDGRIELKKMKPLLQDITLILIDEKTGELVGVRQVPLSGDQLDIDLSKVFHVALRVEGTYWYGESLLENCREAWESWNEANAGAKNYDKKVAGSRFVVYYPPGTSVIDGAKTDNGQIAVSLLSALEHSGSITVPRMVADFIHELNPDTENGWNVESLDSGSAQQGSFNERLRYLDSLKVRGLLIPERSVLEGQFGTKAEAGVHGDLAVTNIQEFDKRITREMNRQVVNQLLALNFGRDMIGKVRLSAMPLIDEQARMFREIYDKILSNPEGFQQEVASLDTDAIKDKLGLPKTEIVTPTGDKDAVPEEELAETKKLAASLGVLSLNPLASAKYQKDGKWLTTKDGHKIFIAPGEDQGDALKDFIRKTEMLGVLDEVKKSREDFWDEGDGDYDMSGTSGVFVKKAESAGLAKTGITLHNKAASSHDRTISSVAKKSGVEPKEMQKSVNEYLGWRYESVQDGAVSLSKNPNHPNIKKKNSDEWHANNLKNFVEKSNHKAPKEMNVFRATDSSKCFNAMEVGKVYKPGKFVSTTADPKITTGFGKKTMVHVVVPKGKQGFATGFVKDRSKVLGKKEVLFSPNARFKVINKTKVKGMNYLQIKFLGN